MSLNDLLDAFDELDPQQRGFITTDEVNKFYSALVESPINEELITAVVENICGHGVCYVPRNSFVDILEELERRRSIESEAFWDFQALDSSGNNFISLSHAFLLFREYHGDYFSLDNWNKFLNSREIPDKDVYFDELRSWLSSPPGTCRPSTQSEIVQEESRLDRVHTEAAYRELEEANLLLDIKDLEKEREEERQQQIEHSVKRKLQKWHMHGLAAMLDDHDGLGLDSDMSGDSLSVSEKESIKTSDVLALLEAKYSILQDRVLMELACSAASIDDEKLEIFGKLKRIASKLQNKKFQDEELSQLIEKTFLPFTLLGVLGDSVEAESAKNADLEELRVQLLQQGKSDVEINDHFRGLHNQIVHGEQVYSSALAQLSLRLKTEREAILSDLHGSHSQEKKPLSSSQILSLHYCSLLRQMRLLQEEEHMTSASLAVGLAERSQEYKPQRYDRDRDRSEWLAKERLKARVGRRQIKRSTTNLDLDPLEKAGTVLLRTKLVEELEQAQYLEREAMVNFLQGNESKANLDAAAGMSSEARQKKIRTLRSRRQECIALNNWTANQTLLAEATALYCEERQKGIDQRETAIPCIVLADLQQRQEIEADRILKESLKQNKQELTRAVLAQVETRQDQLFPNIAFVTLGVLEVQPEDQEFLLTLEAKFKAMRDQVFVFGLIEKMGSGWKSMSKEEKQKEIYQQRKEEKRLRGEGHLQDMAQLIGPRSQALPNLSKLIGERKTFPNCPVQQQESNADDSQSLNLLADLAARFDTEMEGLLSWLQHSDVKSLSSRVKYVQLSRLAAEKFVAAIEASYETSLLAVGLLERIGQPRSKDDQEKQLTLAERRFTLRKLAAMNREQLRSPPEEKLSPKEDNIRDLQLVLTRAMLSRHHCEREMILSVLQDQGMDDLVEAAASMSPDQALSRLKELKTKRSGLNLKEKGDNEEQTYIFEEAGAIRAAQLIKSLSKDLGRTVLLAEGCTHLLAQLQDLQDIELAQLFAQFKDMSTSDISAKTDEEIQARKYNYCNNVMEVFTKLHSNSTEEFEKLVEKKYERLLNLLVEESLCQQYGGRQAWDAQSQKQKSKAISALSAKATELWKKHDQTTLSSWMDHKIQLESSFSYLVGADRESYQESLRSTVPGNKIEESGSSEAGEGFRPEIVADLHRRYTLEAAFIRNYLDGLLDVAPSDDDVLLLRNRLTWEITVLDSAQDFVSSALIVGLAERQTVDMNGRLKHDNARYHMLASHLSGSKYDLPAVKREKTDMISDSTELQALLLRTLHHKHVDEWMVMHKLMSSKEFKTLQKALSVETEVQRDNRITQLHCQRAKLDLKEKSKQHGILEEALVVRQESVRQRMLMEKSIEGQQDIEVFDSDINIRLISQLLQFQMVEAQIHIEAFVAEDAEDLQENYAAIITEISQGHVSNIALVAFTGPHSESSIPAASDEDILNDVGIKQAVDGKYDALKDQLLIQALIDQMGEAEWNRLSDLERQRLLLELKLKQRRLCREGKYDEAAALLGNLQSSEEKIRRILESSKADHERRLRERLERRKARLAEGMSEEECDELEEQESAAELEEERNRKENILLYLDHCNEQEKADLLRRLGNIGDNHERARQRQLELVRQHREERRLRQEDNMDAATLLMGIAKDQLDKSNLSKEEEKLRQKELARQRLEIVRQRQRLQGDNLVRGETILQLDEFENDSYPSDARKDEVVLGMLDVRHARERKALIKLLDEHSDGESRDEARLLTPIEIKDKIEEQREFFDLWRDSEPRAQSDGEKILGDSIGLHIEWKRRELEKEGELVSDEDVKVALLAQLQEIQEAEAGQTMLMLIDVDEDQVEEVIKNQQMMLTNLGHDNLASVLLELPDEEGSENRPDEGGQDDLEEGEKTVVHALEKKYDAMRDKLLIEALMQEMGEAEWSRLSDLERQRKLVELKMRERRLRREGRTDELAQLLGNFAKESDRLSQFLGESAEDQKRRVQEKLALRKRLKEEKEAQGVVLDEENLDKLVEEEDQKIQATNILNHLDKQFEAEKAALLSSLRNQPDQLSREKKRQLELLRFQREQRRLKKEDKLDSVAMIFALGEQNQKSQQQSVISERERQQERARQRLEALKQKRANKTRDSKSEDGEGDGEKEVKEDLPQNNMLDESTLLQSKVMTSIENLQDDERAALVDIISRIDMTKKTKEMTGLTNNDLSRVSCKTTGRSFGLED
ncbi:hypothetical protein EGW08_016571 [Elysia chlorotica]|uniref:EF-hand domain-containing protein n=1 Tax=Elysia chlorotica TaxID=188477 RepID=A0A433T2B5_ELYCH|nr:hypothetical protein EGW08_016571 [Elysia chlorotica]